MKSIKHIVDASEAIFCAGIFLIIFTAYCDAFQDYEEECLTAMNEYRSKHDAPPLKLNDELNKEAQKCAEYYAERKKIDHTCKIGKAGENLYGLKEKDPSEFPSDVVSSRLGVQSWYAERKGYDFKNPGNRNPKKNLAGHFTQLVWKGSAEVGCGVYTVGRFRVVAAIFQPGGNIVRNVRKDKFLRFKQNVSPAVSRIRITKTT